MGMDCIDRKELRDALYDADAITMDGVKILNQFPSADVATVRYGRWENITGGMITLGNCSECKARQPVIGTNYCKNCGAIMEAPNA